MASVIVAFSKAQDARSIKNILVKNGFEVVAACTSGAQALAHMEDLGSGIIVCGYRLADMLFSDLAADMPPDFAMLVLSRQSHWPAQKPDNAVLLPLPLKVHDLIDSLEMLLEMEAHRRQVRRQKPKRRSSAERTWIDEAKKLLMERNGMSEEEAHRYLQKSSMASGTNMAETAQMLISLNNM